MSPRDAEAVLGLRRGRGNTVIECEVPGSAVHERFNATMRISEWVAEGDLRIKNGVRIR